MEIQIFLGQIGGSVVLSGTQLANQVNLGLGEASELGANGLFQIHYTIKSKA